MNNMTDEERFLLTQLCSEHLEAAHRITKALHFGLDEIQPGQLLTNRERIQEEQYDVIGTMDMLAERDILPRPDLETATAKYNAKKEKIQQFMEYGLGRAPHPGR